MKSPKWIRAVDGGIQKPIPHSGGENQQLSGYDASNRKTNGERGQTLTPKILDRNPSRIPIKATVPVSGDAMPPRLPHSGASVAKRKLRPNQKPPRKNGL